MTAKPDPEREGEVTDKMLRAAQKADQHFGNSPWDPTDDNFYARVYLAMRSFDPAIAKLERELAETKDTLAQVNEGYVELIIERESKLTMHAARRVAPVDPVKHSSEIQRAERESERRRLLPARQPPAGERTDTALLSACKKWRVERARLQSDAADTTSADGKVRGFDTTKLLHAERILIREIDAALRRSEEGK